LADQINQVFLHERPELHYVPYVKNPGGHPKAARGKLWSTYHYMRKNFKKYGLICSTENSTASDASNDDGVGEAHQGIF
jgi:hypothetical protein